MSISKPKKVQLEIEIIDRLPGLEVGFNEEFTNAKIQRCKVHAVQNVLAKVLLRHKRAATNDVHTIFHSSREYLRIRSFTLPKINFIQQ